MFKSRIPHICLCTALLAVAQPASAQVDVVVTSKPAHALVAAVMAGVGTPALLVDGTASPHTYAMKPSDAQRVNGAKVFFRISESLEPFTARLMKSLPKSVRTVSLAEVDGINRLAAPVGRHVRGRGTRQGPCPRPQSRQRQGRGGRYRSARLARPCQRQGDDAMRSSPRCRKQPLPTPPGSPPTAQLLPPTSTASPPSSTAIWPR